jgi:hypothetical protein
MKTWGSDIDLPPKEVLDVLTELLFCSKFNVVYYDTRKFY